VVDLAVEVLDTNGDLLLFCEARDLFQRGNGVFDSHVVGNFISVARHGDDVGKPVFRVGFDRGADAGNRLVVLCLVIDSAAARRATQHG